MGRRRRMWTEMNDGVPGARPPFVIEDGTFQEEFLPDSLLRCGSEYGRKLERYFLRNIRVHEILNDDHVCPSEIAISWHVWHDRYGFSIDRTHATDSFGHETGYHTEYRIKDLAQDGFSMIQPARFGVDRERTMEEKAFLNEIFGDIMPVVVRPDHFAAGEAYASSAIASMHLTSQILDLMSMETFFLAMHDCPDKLHGLMALLRDNAMRHAQWAEAEGLLVLNNRDQCTCISCFNFTNLLPKSQANSGPAKLKDMWGVMNSQETIGVSPALFREFCFPYYRDLANMFGLVYWGCCEPVDPIWEVSISQLPNLKAVSVSRWANEEFMADALAGRGIVYSRKPNPNLLGVDVVLNEEAWGQEIRRTLELTAKKNIPLELIVRDVLTLHGNLNKGRSAVEIARREIDRFFGPLSLD